MPRSSPVFVFSGPSGCGKTTICRLLEERMSAYYSISCTTRPKRSGEVDGRDYIFVTSEQFHHMALADEFLEWEEVHDNLYGTPKGPILAHTQADQLVILDVDVKGALHVKRALPSAVLVFIMPPSWEILEERLIARGKDNRDVIAKRLTNARRESEFRDEYDYCVTNLDLEQTYAEIAAIIHKIQPLPHL